jgi:hypothetical protein
LQFFEQEKKVFWFFGQKKQKGPPCMMVIKSGNVVYTITVEH